MVTVIPPAAHAALAGLPAGSVVEVPGGVVFSACVARVRHDPSGSVLSLWGGCPVPLGPRTVASLTGPRRPGRPQAMTLRWGAGATASVRLPVEVAQGELLVVFTRRPAPAAQGVPARAADHVLAS